MIATGSDPKVTDECARLLGYWHRRSEEFGTRLIGDAPSVVFPTFDLDQVGSMRACASDAAEEPYNPACLMMANAPTVTGSSCAPEPIVMQLDGMKKEHACAMSIYFRSEHAILADPEDYSASVVREQAPQCSITLGNLAMCLFNPDLPLFSSYITEQTQARYALESYADRINGPGLPWVGGSLHQGQVEVLETLMIGKLVAVDSTHRELAKMLIRSWVCTLSIWTKTFALPSVVDVISKGFHSGWLPERPQLESMVNDLSIQEYRLLVRLTRDKAESVLMRLYKNGTIALAEQFLRSHSTLEPNWIERAQDVCRTHMGNILRRYLDLRYYHVGVFFDAGRSLIRYAACPEPLMCASFIPIVQTSTRNIHDRNEHAEFVLDFPSFYSSKSMREITLPTEITSATIATDRHDRVESAHYAVQRFMFSTPMIAATSLLENPAGPMHLAHPVSGALVILAVLVIRYMLVAHVMPCLVIANKKNFLQTIDLGAYAFRGLVVPSHLISDTRAALLSYRSAVVLESDGIRFGKFWTDMLGGSMPQKITARAPRVIDPPSAVRAELPPASPVQPAVAQVSAMDTDETSETPAPVAIVVPDMSFSARGSLSAFKKKTAPGKRTAKVLDDETLSEEQQPLANDGDAEDEEAMAEPEPKAKQKRATRSHKIESSSRKSRMRVRQKMLIKQAGTELAKIGTLIRERQAELNQKGHIDEQASPKIAGHAHAVAAKTKQKLSVAQSTYQRNRISDVNRSWRIVNDLHFFGIHAVYRTKHNGPVPNILMNTGGTAVAAAVVVPPVRGLTMSLHPLSTPFPANPHMGASRLEHLPKLRSDPTRDTIQPDYNDPETIDVLYQTIKENTTIFKAEFERDKTAGASNTPPLRTLKQVYAMFIYYNNHCHTAGPKIVASQGRHVALLKTLAKRFDLTAPGKTPKAKIFAINTTSRLYPLTADHRASTTFQADKWLVSMHQPFLHASDAPLE